MSALEKAFARVRKIADATGLAGIETSTSYGTPALKARGKLLVRMKDAETLVCMCPMEEKMFLMEAASDMFYETDHYRGYPAVLLRLDVADDETISGRIQAAVAMQAKMKAKR